MTWLVHCSAEPNVIRSSREITPIIEFISHHGVLEAVSYASALLMPWWMSVISFLFVYKRSDEQSSFAVPNLSSKSSERGLHATEKRRY